jgi:hypothetical protein
MQHDARLRTVTKCYPSAARDLPPKAARQDERRSTSLLSSKGVGYRKQRPPRARYPGRPSWLACRPVGGAHNPPTGRAPRDELSPASGGLRALLVALGLRSELPAQRGRQDSSPAGSLVVAVLLHARLRLSRQPMRRLSGRKRHAAARPRRRHKLLLTAPGALAPAAMVNPFVLWRLHRSHQNSARRMPPTGWPSPCRSGDLTLDTGSRAALIPVRHGDSIAQPLATETKSRQGLGPQAARWDRRRRHALRRSNSLRPIWGVEHRKRMVWHPGSRPPASAARLGSRVRSMCRHQPLHAQAVRRAACSR